MSPQHRRPLIVADGQTTAFVLYEAGRGNAGQKHLNNSSERS